MDHINIFQLASLFTKCQFFIRFWFFLVSSLYLFLLNFKKWKSLLFSCTDTYFNSDCRCLLFTFFISFCVLYSFYIIYKYTWCICYSKRIDESPICFCVCLAVDFQIKLYILYSSLFSFPIEYVICYSFISRRLNWPNS